MNDPLEERLARMQPAPLPKGLMAQLIAARPQPAVTPSSLPSRMNWLGFALKAAGVLAVAAVVSTLFVRVAREARTGIGKNPTHLAAAASRLQAKPLLPSDLRVFAPIEERSYLVAERDLGVIDAEPSRPMRLVHQTWIDDTTYRGDDGTSTFRRSAPRAEIVPVLLEVY